MTKIDNSYVSVSFLKPLSLYPHSSPSNMVMAKHGPGIPGFKKVQKLSFTTTVLGIISFFIITLLEVEMDILTTRDKDQGKQLADSVVQISPTQCESMCSEKCEDRLDKARNTCEKEKSFAENHAVGRDFQGLAGKQEQTKEDVERDVSYYIKRMKAQDDDDPTSKKLKESSLKKKLKNQVITDEVEEPTVKPTTESTTKSTSKPTTTTSTTEFTTTTFTTTKTPETTTDLSPIFNHDEETTNCGGMHGVDDFMIGLKDRPDLGLEYFPGASEINIHNRYAIIFTNRLVTNQTVGYMGNIPLACLAWQQMGYGCFIVIPHDRIDEDCEPTVRSKMLVRLLQFGHF